MRVLAVLLLFVGLAPYTPVQVAEIEKIPVGMVGTITEPAGDGCNICTWNVRRVSETEVQRLTTGTCTLMSCPLRTPVERFKPVKP